MLIITTKMTLSRDQASFVALVRGCLEDADENGQPIARTATSDNSVNALDVSVNHKTGKQSMITEGFKCVNVSALTRKLQEKLKAADVSITCTASPKYVDNLRLVIITKKNWRRGFWGTALQAAGYFFMFSLAGCASKWFGVV
jgi:hypothetical protein